MIFDVVFSCFWVVVSVGFDLVLIYVVLGFVKLNCFVVFLCLFADGL